MTDRKDEILDTSLPLLTLDEFKKKLSDRLPGFVTDKIELFDEQTYFEENGDVLPNHTIMRGMILLPMVFSLKQPKADGEFRLTDRLVDGIVKKVKNYYQLSNVENL